MNPTRFIVLLMLAALSISAIASQALGQDATRSLAIRVATFNVEDARTEDLLTGEHPRLKAVAEIIQRLRPNVLLLNEIAYDTPGAPGVPTDAEAGQNAARFVANYLAVAQADDVGPIVYDAFMAPSNTGAPSGFDLDRSGEAVTAFPAPPESPDGWAPGPQSAPGRAYGNDSWGFGTFPGQYAMAVLVDPRLEIVEAGIRTFRLLPWSAMPNAMLPTDAEGDPWYADDAGELMRLSSKSHWDIPVRLPNGAVLHMLASHPTPPAFDATEQRNKKRNHDEIRFWADYLDDAGYIIDDRGRIGGLNPRASFVIMGDLNADPDEGSSIGDPIGDFLLSHDRVNGDYVPTATIPVDGLDDDDTARFRLRVDYVLPSTTLNIGGGGVWRSPATSNQRFPSDHYPVWLDLAVPAG